LNVRRLESLSIMLIASVFYSAQGWADAWQQTGSARISTEYDSNPAMSATSPDGIWRAIFEPGYTLNGILGDNELKAGLAIQMARSSNETLSQNRADPSAFVDWQRQSDAGEFGISSRYAETATRIAEIGNAGPGVSDSTRVSRTTAGRWNKALSERSALSAEGSYEDVSYKGGTYIDYLTRSASMMFRYAWSEHSTPFLKIAHSDYEPTRGGAASRLDTGTLGMSWTISDNLEGNLQASKSKVNDAEMGTQGAASLQYTGPRTQLVLNAGRQVSPSGLGGFSTVDQASGSWSYTLSERSKTGIDLGWSKNHYISDIINRTTGVWLQHDLNSFWGMRTYYLHRTIEQDGLGSASSNILGLAFTYTHTDF
jgi:hypothetical protein